MWDLIFYVTFAATSIYTWDFVFTEKSYHGEIPHTDASRVAELYSKIKTIKKSQVPSGGSAPSTWDVIKLHVQTGVETGKTLAKYKYQRFMNQYYTPKKIGEHLIVLPYYFGGTWWNALVQHSSKTSNVIKITCTYPDSSDPKDVTNEIKPVMGPSEDFYGQRITPEQLGYPRLTFTRLVDGAVQVQEYSPAEIIGV